MSNKEAVLAEPDAASSVTTPDAPGAKPLTPEMEEFTLGKRGQLAFFTLSVLTLMVALDGTSISVALPVRILNPYWMTYAHLSRLLRATSEEPLLKLSGVELRSSWRRQVRTISIPRWLSQHPLTNVRSIPTELCLAIQYLRSPASYPHRSDALLCRDCRLLSRQGLYIHACRTFSARCRRWRLDCA
jgi:hypothetical protein